MPIWSSRFSEKLDSTVNDFNSSISFDCVMYKQDIRGSIAHATMLGEQGIIPVEDAQKIIEGLKGIERDLESGALEIDHEAEDIHMFIEQVLTERIGDAGKRLHTARSRNDQVALDVRMYLAERTRSIRANVRALTGQLCDMAEEHIETVMPGYTHMQVAQPITLGHHLMAYAQMLRRDIDRLDDCLRRLDFMPLGSGALAGTTYPIDRRRVAELLGFSRITENSLDGVSDRDFCIELNCAMSLIMTHLSRFSEEIVIWCSNEFKFIELSDAYSTGSSIMPQKKNPDITELVRGKTGRVNGNLVTLLTMMKGLPLAYNKDTQEDKQAIFDSLDTVELCLGVFAPMLKTMKVNKARMRQAAASGFINATDCADYLVRKGMPFRDAYRITGALVRRCVEEGRTLEALTLSELRESSELFDNDVYDAISIETCVSQRDCEGGPSPRAVAVQIERMRGELEKL